MANRTVKDAQSIHGTNPQYLVEKIIRTRIYDSKYWKEQCFALTAELLVDKAMDLKAIGGVFGGNIKPTPFLCLTLKMLQIQPEKDIIIEFIKQDDFKYVRALGAFYMRLVHSSLDCYKYLEPLLNDYRKLRMMNRGGQYELSHMDEFIDILLRDDRVCDIMLPRIQKRWVHEGNNELDGRVSLLDDDLDDLESESDEDEFPPSPPPTPPNRRVEKDDRRIIRDDRHLLSRRMSPQRNGIRGEREKRHRSRSRERGQQREEHERKKRRSRSRERKRKSPGRHHRHRERVLERGHNYEGRDREEKRREREEREYHGREHYKERRERGREHDRERRKHHRRDKEHRGVTGDYNSEDQDIAEANALRMKLGLAPLRR